jgi:hypothetical protein
MSSVALRSVVPLLSLVVGPAVLAQTIWVEGERPLRAAVTRHPSWYDVVRKDQLSGGDWISHWSDTQPGVVEYALVAPKAASYSFWVRANPVATTLDYSLDGGPWTPIPMDQGAVDSTNVAGDGKADLRFLAWKKVGGVPLKPGRHVVRFRMRSENHFHGALDAFVFTTERFLPQGTSRPGEATLSVPPGTWPFLTERDPFQEGALLDLRNLNEQVAGQSGFVRLSPDGEGFALGDGTPVRFWGITTSVQRDRSAEDLVHHARFLAKRGVNMVRYHGHLEPKNDGSRLTDADHKALQEAWKLVAAMKQVGIYTTLSPYWAANLKKVPAAWGIEGWPEDASPQGLLFFNDRLQEAYKAWMKALLTQPNPYTGIPLAQDPALAIIQLQNEDSLLFWTQQTIKGKQLELLGRKFAAWLTRKYGSLEAAQTAWNGVSMPEDRFAEGVVGIHIVWQFTQPQSGGMKTRLDDQLHFFADTMAEFNRSMAKYLREELGCRQLINAGNWRTADTIKLDDVERWTYSVNEVIGVNRYYSPVHLGPDQGWRINPGDYFQDRSVLLNPRDLPVNLRQLMGHPIIVSESHWVPPLSYQSEGPFLVAAYQSLTGVDTFYWFTTSEAEWSDQDRAPWDSASRFKWTVATPMVQGQFPAAALMYRKGYIQQGEPVVVEHRSLDQLWQRVPPLIAEDPGYDPNRDLGDAPKRSNLSGGVDPLAFLVGPVKVALDSDPSLTRVADLSKFLDPQRRVAQSNTGQIRLDYGRGLCGINAPRAQGATGFLDKAGLIKLNDVTIRSANDYATVLLVSLDGEPIARSKRVLVQVGTRARPMGWVEKAAEFKSGDGQSTYQGKQVTDTGRMPWLVAEARISLAVKNPTLTKATRLDLNGYPQGVVPAEAKDGGLTLTLPRDALYVVLEGH